MLEFLRAHHTTDDDLGEARTEASVERSVEAMYDPWISCGLKQRFVERLRADLAEIRKDRVPEDEDVTKIVDRL